MASLSFELQTASDLLNKLEGDFRIYCDDRLSSSKAINCVYSAWHLSDWWYEESTGAPSEEGKRAYQRKLREDHDFLRFMSDLANGSKHVRLSDPKVRVKSTKTHNGDFSDDFSDDFDISRLVLVLKDGIEVDFQVELSKAIEYWRAELRK
jgi:hypothetical protein